VIDRRAFARGAVCALALAAALPPWACTSANQSFGLTREASNEGRRSLEIECAGTLAFSPDGALFASSDGRSLQVRQSPSGRPEEKLGLRDDVAGHTGACIAFSPDGRWLASSCRGETGVKIFERDSWKERSPVTLGGELVTAIAFAGDSSELAVGTSASRIELCVLADGARRVLRKPARASDEHGEGLSFLAYVEGDQSLLAATGAGDVVAIDRAQGDVMWSRADERVLALARDGRRALTASRANGEARLLELGAGEPALVCKLPDPDGNGVALAGVFAPDGAWLGVSYSRHLLGANWQSLEFFRIEPMHPAAARPAFHEGVSVPREKGHRPHSSQVRQAALDPPEGGPSRSGPSGRAHCGFCSGRIHGAIGRLIAIWMLADAQGQFPP
jgi:hypothetical protein